MQIRLGLLHEDFANRFLISKTLASRIFSTWVKATASVLKSLVFVPKMENIVACRSYKFRKFSRLHSIADATEIFLQTPKIMQHKELLGQTTNTIILQKF